MKRKNSTRNALVTSIISLLLCVSMLVGTTFAWFTDTVESGVNVINAGNLDVELYHGKGADPSEKVDNSDKLFTDFNGNLIELWEPGVVAYTNLKVANEGTLALTYQMAINFTNMNYVENDGDRYTLADVLKVAVVEGGFTGDRAAAQALEYNYTLATFGLEGVLEADETTKTYGVVIYWEPNDNTYDNLFNLNNGKTSSDNNPLHVDLGISLFATQEKYEEDSFDDTYDENAKLELPEIKAEAATTNAFLEALAAGKTAVLTADLALDDGDFVIPEGVTSAINLNGHTLTVGANGGIQATGNLLLTGTGNVNVTAGEGGTYAGFLVDEGATMEIGEGVTINTPSNAIGVWVLGDLIVDGATINAAAGSHGIFTHESGETDITINSGSVNGDGDAIYIGWNVNADIVIGEDAQVGKIVGGYGGTTANITYYGDPTLDIAENAAETINLYNIRNVETDEELADAINDCANEIILAEGEFTADLYNIVARDSMIITGQGADTKLNFKQGQVRLSQFNKLTISNCEIGRMVDKYWGQLVFGSSTEAGGVYTISNCIFNGEDTQGIYINQNVDATINIENCIFNGDFGSEGAITIQNNDAVFTVNVKDCEFNNIPDDSHDIYVVPYQDGGWTLNVDGKATVATAKQLAAVVANGATDIYLLDGNYTMPQDYVFQGKTLTISGTKDAVIDISAIPTNGSQAFTGATLVFDGVTLNCATQNYKGFTHAASLTYKNCQINGLQFLFAENVTFENCDFDSNGAEHSIWTYGSKNVSFVDCDFTYGDRAVNCYAEDASSRDVKVTFTDCTFTKVAGKETTGAIETNSSLMNSLTLTINNCTVNEGDLWFIAGWDSLGGANTTVTVNESPDKGVVLVQSGVLPYLTINSNATYMLVGDFGGQNVSLVMPVGVENVIFDGSKATNINELIIVQNGKIIDNANDPIGERSGNVTVQNFNVLSQINVFACKTEVVVQKNTAEALMIHAGNCDVKVLNNTIDANFESHPTYQNATKTWNTNNYGIALNIFDYNLWLDGNTVTDAIGHAIGINGWEGTIDNGDENVIESFKSNTITVNSTSNTKRAAFKVWDDETYASNDGDTNVINAAAQAFINAVLADGSNTFNIVDGYDHTIFSFYNVNTNN